MNEKITLQDIVNLFSQKQGIGKKEADLIVRTMFDLIEEALKTENYVKIKGFGTFKLTEVDARESVNVNTGERFEIQGHSKISFTPDTTMKDLINKPFAHFETVILNDGVELEDTPTEEVLEAPEMVEETPAIVEATPIVAEETQVVVEETIIEETPAPEATEVPVVVEEEPTIVEETPAVEEPIEEVVEETAPEQAEETPMVEEPAIEELIASEPVTETVPEEKPIRHQARSKPANTSAGEIKYSSRGKPSDSFDPSLVASLMTSYLQERTPIQPLAATTNLTFVQKLEQHIRNKHLVEADVYKAALMDRRLFSKIICNNNYKPSKDTALALVFALKLNLGEAKDLLERAGYTLSHSIQRDIIIEYFIKERIYNLNNINAFLYNMDEKIIGRSV